MRTGTVVRVVYVNCDVVSRGELPVVICVLGQWCVLCTSIVT